MEWIASGPTSRSKRIMESKLMNYDNFHRDFYRQLKADQKRDAAIKQRLKIALIIGGIIICLMLMIS
jgi:hypothetical protein